jgi:xanthine dehydrogenase YagR molybdenum-binding subunit
VTTAYIGQPIGRLDGLAKVTGTAKYAFEYDVPNVAYAYVVSSSIARGRINRIDTTAVLQLPGVLHVLTHENTPRVAPKGEIVDDARSPGAPFIPLQGDEVFFNHQPVALVVADTFELARYAASLVRIEYDAVDHATDLEAARRRAYVPRPRAPLPPTPSPRGDAEKALADAAVRIDVEYRVPAEHPNPMEPFATTVVWEGDGKLTLYDKTQGVQNVQGYLCSVFGYSKNDVRVLSPFVGGAFGAGLRPQYQAFLAVLAARALKRSVKVALTRQQMFSLHYRPFAWQRVAVGAAPDGRLEAIVHEAITGTSRFEDYSEQIVPWSGLLYRCDNVTLDNRVTKLDLNTPGDVRAPGASWGVYALECAMDELAVALRMDPVDLRLKNYADRDQIDHRAFSSKSLRECYRLGAERFEWGRRNPNPRSMRDGNILVGMGMATGAWDAFQFPASARCVLNADGTATVSSATEDIGTGTYTVMTQIAADALGLPIDRVTFKLGDSELPEAPLEGGSFTVSSVGSAVRAACEKVRARIVAGEQGAGKATVIDEQASTLPSPRRKDASCYCHSAVFAEVRVDEDLGTIQVARVVTAVAPGRVINPRTARSQLMGGIVWGIGMALEEEGVIDQTFGRFMNHSFGEYHVPVNADVHDIDVIFVEEQDEIVNPLGAKGLGEVGVVGVAAAIANAIFHATGRRVRDLPITLDKLI